MNVIVGQGEQLARTFVAAVGSGDPVRWAAMFTDDATYATPDFPNPLRGRDALKAMAATYFKAFPDMAFEVRSVIEQGNVVVLEGATKGTFTGPMMTADGEVPPTGMVAVRQRCGCALLSAPGDGWFWTGGARQGTGAPPIRVVVIDAVLSFVTRAVPAVGNRREHELGELERCLARIGC